jgi:mono/diheme cytochrome c family protein
LLPLALVWATMSAYAAQVAPGGGHAGDALALLEAHCVKCHGGEKTKGGLDLTRREALLLGGESGPAFTAGQPVETGLLYRMVAHLEEPGMPHKEDKLSDAAIARIADWLRAGAPYRRALKTEVATSPSKSEFTLSAADRAHWSFQPVKRPNLPAVKNRAWPRNPVDHFILAAQETKGLQPSAPAGRETLIRRVTLDLIGLPPTPSEIDAFVGDASPNAYEKLLDRLLASPHYGERWGRHWLDLARFAESDGFEHDAVRPHAWRYRDYVVRAFNADKPYDRFIREQVAGDELFPGDPDALTATAFNLLGPDMVDSADQVQRRRNTLNDMTDTTSLTFLGLTMGCARCHDHKFEPIAQKDYYSLQAFFASAKFRNDLPVPSVNERETFEAAMKVYNEQTHTQQQQIADLESPYRATLYERKLAKLSAEAQTAHRTPKEQRTTEQENQIQETAEQLEITSKELIAAMNKDDRERHKNLLDQLKPFPKPKPLPASLALQNGPAVKTHVLFRGDYNQPGEETPATFPEVLRGIGPGLSTAGSTRATLANWIASPQHPLTARVIVNRIWQHHFGQGLVPTPSDFGTHGQKPTHPALLDWLASEFVARGWSVKQMHKLMLLSATYQQSTGGTSPRDPENRFYTRMNRVRLEGEVIRDSLLFISGQLNPKMGGPGVFPPIPKELFAGAKGWTPGENTREHARRSVYIFVRRNLRFPFLEVFDAPDNNLSCANRESSTTAPQSLTLLNADEVVTAAQLTAERIASDHTPANTSRDSQIIRAYRLIIGRAPTERELTLARDFLAHSPLNEFCRALFNLNAFVYAD